MTLPCRLFYVGNGDMPDILREPLSRHLAIIDQHFDLARYITDEEFQHGVWHSDDFAMVTLGRPLLRGEVGCALAHQHIYSMASAGTSEWSLILEDDVKWCVDFEARLVRAISSLGKIDGGPAVILLGWHERGIGPAVGSKHLRRLLGIPTGTFAYLINKPAAKLFSEAQKIEHLADWPINASQVRFYRAESPIFLHDSQQDSVVDKASSISRAEADSGRLGVLERVLHLKSKPQAIAFIHFVAIRAIAFLFERALRDVQSSILTRNRN